MVLPVERFNSNRKRELKFKVQRNECMNLKVKKKGNVAPNSSCYGDRQNAPLECLFGLRDDDVVVEFETEWLWVWLWTRRKASLEGDVSPTRMCGWPEMWWRSWRLWFIMRCLPWTDSLHVALSVILTSAPAMHLILLSFLLLLLPSSPSFSLSSFSTLSIFCRQ